MAGKIIIVDDEAELLEGLQAMLAREFPKVEIFTSICPAQALVMLQKQPVNLVLTDVRMPGMNGLDLLPELKKLDPTMAVLVMTAFGSIETAVNAVKKGAYDFICKPFNYPQLFLSVKKGLEHNRLVRENISLRRRMSDRTVFENFVGQSAVMRQFYDNIKAVAHSNYTVLVRGESGTGKELTAKAIHRQSKRKDGNLVMVNCPAIPEHLLESELFGHKKGAFTGADYDHGGLFAEAAGGTICLDEIGDIPVSVQVKLLRVLQENELRPIGASRTRKIDVRVIALTNQNLEEKISNGQFREDLFYRLNVVTVRTPKLDEIRDDIPMLINHFGKITCNEQGVPLKKFSPEFIKAMSSRPWPGNVRQLQNMIIRSVVFCQGDEVCLSNLEQGDEKSADSQAWQDIIGNISGFTSYKAAKENVLKEFSRQYLGNILQTTNGNVTRASTLSGLSRAAFQKIMHRFAIKSDEFRHTHNHPESYQKW